MDQIVTGLRFIASVVAGTTALLLMVVVPVVYAALVIKDSLVERKANRQRK